MQNFIQNILAYQRWHPLITASLMIVTIIVVGILAYWLIKQIFKSLAQISQGNKNFATFIKHWRNPIIISFTLLIVYLSQPFIVFAKKTPPYYFNVVALLNVFLITWLLVQIVYSIRNIILNKYRYQKVITNLSFRKIHTQINILVKIIAILIIIIGCASALLVFPKIQQIGISILASAGIAGVIIGFAAQKSLGNLLAGIQIAFTQPIRIDDVVIVENEWGIIEEITLTYVVVRIWDQRRLIVPINYFIEHVFQNWTRQTSELIGAVYLEVDYTAPIQAIRDEVDKILNQTPLWDGKVKNLAVTEAKTQTIELRILASAKDASTTWDLRCYLREKLIAYLQKNHPQCLPKVRQTTLINNSSNSQTIPLETRY